MITKESTRKAHLQPILREKYLSQIASNDARASIIGQVEFIKVKRGAGFTIVLRMENGLAELYVPEYISPAPALGDWIEATGFLVPPSLTFRPASIVPLSHPPDNKLSFG